jgi:hypothetical protein
MVQIVTPEGWKRRLSYTVLRYCLIYLFVGYLMMLSVARLYSAQWMVD